MPWCIAAEKGPWGEVLRKGGVLFERGDFDSALLAYLRAAEMGYELGQSNAAWMLSRVGPAVTILEDHARVFRFFQVGSGL